MAIRGFIVTGYSPLKELGDCHHFAPIIMTAGVAQMVWTLQFTAIGTFLIGSNFERIMAAAHAALRGRCFSFGDSHFGTCSISKSISSKTPLAKEVVVATNSQDQPRSSAHVCVNGAIYLFFDALQVAR
jgi:predicted HAD superfamily Cof-like phosphohydrolase